MDVNDLSKLKASAKTKHKWDEKAAKAPQQVKKEIQQFNTRVHSVVKKKYGHDAQPIFVDKG